MDSTCILYGRNMSNFGVCYIFWIVENSELAVFCSPKLHFMTNGFTLIIKNKYVFCPLGICNITKFNGRTLKIWHFLKSRCCIMLHVESESRHLFKIYGVVALQKHCKSLPMLYNWMGYSYSFKMIPESYFYCNYWLRYGKIEVNTSEITPFYAWNCLIYIAVYYLI